MIEIGMINYRYCLDEFFSLEYIDQMKNRIGNIVIFDVHSLRNYLGFQLPSFPVFYISNINTVNYHLLIVDGNGAVGTCHRS